MAAELASDRCRPVEKMELFEDPELRDFMATDRCSPDAGNMQVFEVCSQGAFELSKVTYADSTYRRDRSRPHITVIARRQGNTHCLLNSLSHSLSVERTIIWRSGVDDRSMEILGKSFSSGSCRIRSLHLPRNLVSPVGVQWLSRGLGSGRCVLHTLDLTDNVVGDQGCRYLGKVLGACASLRVLDLRSNGIGHDGAAALADALAPASRPATGRASPPPPSQLERLLLPFNSIGDIGAGALARALKSNCFLVALDVAKNDISPFGARLFAAAISHNRALQALTVRACPVDNMQSDALRSLILAQNVEDAVEYLPAQAALAFMMALHDRLGQKSRARPLPDALARHVVMSLCSVPRPRRIEY